MKKYMYTIIAVMLLIIVDPAEAMENNGVLVKTLDDKGLWFPQWKIEGSRVLQTKQEWQAFKEKYHGALPAPITLKTIDQEKLQLFSDALDAHDFGDYLNTLSDTKKSLLLSLARPQELNSWYIMGQFLIRYGIQHLIEKYLPTTEVAMYLQGLVIADNCRNKKFTQTPITKYRTCLLSNFKSSYQCYSTLYTGYYNLPPLFANAQSSFSGITNPSLIRLSNESDKCWLIQNCTKSENKILYYFTSIDPVDNINRYEQLFIKENKKKLWAINSDTNAESYKIIEHINPIELSVFSKDGKYLATASAGNQGELVLSDLTVKNNKFIGFDVLLTGHEGWIGPVCFNKKSTVIAAVSDESVYMWNVQEQSLLRQFRCPYEITNIISFNHDDSRFVTITFDDHANVSVITLWDAVDIKNMLVIKTIEWPDQFVTGISFTPSGGNLIIEAKSGVRVLDGLSGEEIMETILINQGAHRPLSCVNAVLMPHVPMLVTTAHNDKGECTVALWDVNTKKSISLLLENQKDLVGIGISPSGRCVYSMTHPFGMITTTLYDDFVAKTLGWIDNKLNILQRYVLRRLCELQKNNESVALHSDSPEYCILQSLPTAPCAVKEMIEKYLLKKNNKEKSQ